MASDELEAHAGKATVSQTEQTGVTNVNEEALKNTKV